MLPAALPSALCLRGCAGAFELFFRQQPAQEIPSTEEYVPLLAFCNPEPGSSYSSTVSKQRGWGEWIQRKDAPHRGRGCCSLQLGAHASLVLMAPPFAVLLCFAGPCVFLRRPVPSQELEPSAEPAAQSGLGPTHPCANHPRLAQDPAGDQVSVCSRDLIRSASPSWRQCSRR